MGQRNSHIINHTLRIYLIASILAGIVVQLNSTIDSIVVGQYIAADSISVVALAMPIVNLLMIPSVMIMMGSSILMAPALGNQDYRRSDSLVMTASVLFLVLNMILLVFLYIFTDQISALITQDPRLAPMLRKYLPFAFIGGIFALFANCWSQFVKICGQPRLVLVFVIVFILGNLAFDLLLVKVFGVGIRGIALGSTVAAVLAFGVMVPYLRREPRPFRFRMPSPRRFLKLLAEILRTGLPAIFTGISTIILTLGLNTIVLSIMGPDGMFPLSICMQLFLIAMLIYTGIGTCITGIGGIMLGEQDYDGVIRLVKSTTRTVLIVSAIAMAVLIAIPGPIATLFGADEQFRALAIAPIRIFSFLLIPAGLILVMANAFMVLGYNKLAGLVQAAILLSVLPLAIILPRWNVDWLWYALPVGMSVALIVGAFASVYVYRNWKRDDTDGFVVSVEYSRESVNRNLDILTAHLKNLELDSQLETAVNHCVEEIMIHELEMAAQCGMTGCFDIGISRTRDRLTIIVKSIGRAYNPMVEYQPTLTDTDADPLRLSMMIVEGFCRSIDYRYRNGVNSLYLNFSY